MSTASARTDDASTSIKGLEPALLDGDLSRLSETQRIQYYTRVCESVGLNPITKPFEYLRLNGKMIMYATRACTDQLRHIHKVSLTIVSRERLEGVYVVTARATMPDGRTDESIGAVPLDGVKGEALSNALMKAETKAKRRVTMAICGLSLLDETEVESIPAARKDVPRVRSLDDVAFAAGGQRAVERPTVSAGDAVENASSAERSAGAASTMPSSASAAASADGELLDAASWRSRYEAEAEAAMQAGAIFDAEDDLHMPIPPFDVPKIDARAKQHAGKPYTDVPGGYLREVIAAHKSFGERSIGVRLWTLYLIARHELSKQAKETV
jgi:hypothetical protein